MDQKKIRFLKGLSTAMVFAFLIAGIRIFGVQVYGVLPARWSRPTPRAR